MISAPHRAGWPHGRGAAYAAAAAVLGVAVGVRALALVQAPRAPFWSAPIVDEEAYLALAKGLLAGTPLPHGAWYQTPGYAYFLAGILRLGGGALAAKVVQLIAGAVTALLLWALGRRWFGSAAGLVAGLAWAVAPLALLHELMLLKPALSVLLVVASIAVVALGSGRTLLRWLAWGLLAGLASLLQGELAGVALLTLGIGWVGHRRGWSLAPSPRAAVLATLALLAVLAVPTAQNMAQGGGFVVVAYGGGTNFFIGNHPGADGSYLPLRPDRSDATVEEGDAVAIATTAAGRPLQAAEVSRYWLGQGLGWWRTSPAAALGLTLKKLLLVWGGQEQADVLDLGLAARWLPVLRNPIVRPRVILPMALVALWVTRRRRDLWLPQAFLAASTVMLVPFFLFERFRMPMTAVALPFAAHGAVAWVGAVRARVAPRAVAGLAVAAALALLLGLPRVHRDREVLRVNIGGMLLQAGRYQEALEEFQAVRAASPQAWRVDMNIATTLAMMGRPEEALRALDVVTPRLLSEQQRTGRTPVEELLHCHALAGDLLMSLGRPRQALEAYEAAAALAPGHPLLQQRLQEARARLGASPP